MRVRVRYGKDFKMKKSVTRENRPDIYAPLVHVSVIRGGAISGDGTGSVGMNLVANSIQLNMPGVQVATWDWGQVEEVHYALSQLSRSTKRILVGFSGGGSRITWIARLRPLQTIDLAIGYDPSPIADMRTLRGTKVKKAICYHNNCPNCFWYGGGQFTGIAPNIHTKQICEQHLAVQCDRTLHRGTFQAIADLAEIPISKPMMNRLLADARCPWALMENAQIFVPSAPMANPIGSPELFSTECSTSHNDNGHSTTSGLRGTLQKYDDGSTIIEATEGLNAYRKDIGLNGSLTAFCRRVQKGNVITVQQGNYSYEGRQLPLSSLFLKIDGIPIDAPTGFEATAVRTVEAIRFGKNDQGEGTGSPHMSLIQTNSELFGASVKPSIMKKIFGLHWNKSNKRLGAMIELFFARKRRMVRVPLVDVGPGEKAKSRTEVDLTWACDQFLGTEGGSKIQYRLLLPLQPPIGSVHKTISKTRRGTRAHRVIRR